MDLSHFDNLWRRIACLPAFHTTALPQALILAAGIGRRLGEPVWQSRELPKAMLDFGGKTLLARHIGILRRLGISDITVVIGFGADEMRAALTALNRGRRPLSWSIRIFGKAASCR